LLLKRTAEFVTGLIGSVLGSIIMLTVFVLTGSTPATEGNTAFYGSFIFLAVQISGVVFSCLVNRMNNKSYGTIMIFIGIINLIISLFGFWILFIPAVLYLVSGGMAFRKIKSSAVISG
jgi:hypothetical protein